MSLLPPLSCRLSLTGNNPVTVVVVRVFINATSCLECGAASHISFENGRADCGCVVVVCVLVPRLTRLLLIVMVMLMRLLVDSYECDNFHYFI